MSGPDFLDKIHELQEQGEFSDSGIAPPDPPDQTIAAFGDSLMWGQGVARPERFSLLTAQGIRKLVPNPTDGPMLDWSRSGAQIKVRDGSDREDFADDYPSLLPTDTAVEAFLVKGDESAAQQLFGEVPCSFPTVTWQVGHLADSVGRNIEVALLSGGANDIGFEAVLDPTENQDTFVDKFAGDIREICHKDTLDLLTLARQKMPNAVILLFGYHPPFSYQTDLGDLAGYFRHELDSDVKWYINAAADFFGISGSVDVDKATAEARVRSVWAQGLATYWQRKAVTDANRDDAIRGPGVVFVPCGFKPHNSAFTSQPMVSGDYKHPASDSMQADRVREIPRIDALQDLEGMLFGVTEFDNFEGAKALRDKIDGPKSLEVALFTRQAERGRTPAEHLAREIYRIHRALIASFLHPNRQGDQQIANMAVGRYKAHRLAIDSLPAHGGLLGGQHLGDFPGGPESLEPRLSRFGLRGQGPLQADVGHEFVDAIRVRVSTSRSSAKGFSPDLILLLILTDVVGGHHNTITLQLNMQYYEREFVDIPFVEKFHPELEPDRTDEFSIDVSGHTSEGQLLLKDLIGMKLVVGDWPINQTWLPEDLTLDINGVQVLTRDLRGTRLGPRGSVDLEYPDPVQVGTPVLAPTAVRIGPVPQ
jgi:hypothetical protein